MNNMSDREAVAIALENPIFFGHIVDRYQDKLARYIHRLGVRNPDDRDDVLQEIFVKVYRNLNGFDETLSFSAWIYRIAHNEAISWYRKRRVRPEGNLVQDGESLLEALASDVTDTEVSFDQGLNADEVSKALQEVPEKYRDVLILRFYEQLSYEEIADVLKLPVGTVGTYVHRGKSALKDNLDTNKLHL